MRIGKLTPQELQDCVLGIISKRRNEVIKSACVGNDSAEFRSDDMILITVDPITGATADCGSLSVNICCNDIAAAGGEPLAVLLSVLAPKDADLKDIKNVMVSAEKTAESLNVEIVGGHTEFTDAVNRMVVCASAVGLRKNNRVFCHVKSGDSIVVTKQLGLEGTAIIVKDYKDRLCLSEAEEIEAKSCIDSISVVKESMASECVKIGAMHDITEGGVFGAICEVMEGLGLGAEIDGDKVPFKSVTIKICNQLGLDRFRLLSSGSMLFITSEPQLLIKNLKKEGIIGTEIGKVTDLTNNRVFVTFENERKEIIARRDEIGRLEGSLGE